MQSVGAGCCVSICVTIFVNLSFTPSLLLEFPLFFSTETYLETCCDNKTNSDDYEYIESLNRSEVESGGNSSSESLLETGKSGSDANYPDTAWHKLAFFITKSKLHAWFFILLIFGILLFLSVELF